MFFFIFAHAFYWNCLDKTVLLNILNICLNKLSLTRFHGDSLKCAYFIKTQNVYIAKIGSFNSFKQTANPEFQDFKQILVESRIGTRY